MKKIIFILIILLTTGCWNYRELNGLAIITGIAVDTKDDEFEITLLISNSQEQSSGSGEVTASSAVYKGSGKTIYEAIKDAAMSISKQTYISHLEVLVLSEDIAKNNTMDVIDFFFRYPETRNEFLVVIAQDCKAGDAFDVTTPLETYPSQNISKNLEITDKLQGYLYTVTFNDFVKALIEEGTNPLLPTLSIVGDIEKGNKDENIQQNEPDAYIKLGMMAIFNGAHLVNIAEKDESKGINFINDKINTTLVNAELEDGVAVIELSGSKSKIDVEIENDKPKFKIEIKAIGSIVEVNSNIKVNDAENIKKIKSRGEDKIKDFVNIAIDYSKDNKTDLFGLGNLIYRKDHKLWKKIKNNWQTELLSDVDIEVKVKLDLKTKGSSNNIIEVK